MLQKIRGECGILETRESSKIKGLEFPRGHRNKRRLNMKKHSKKLILVLLIFCIALVGSVSIPTTEKKVYAATKKVKLKAPKVKCKLSSDNTLTLTWKKVANAKGYTVWIYRENEDIDDFYYIEKRKNVYSLKYTCDLESEATFYKIVVKAFGKSKGKKVYGKGYTKKISSYMISF